MRVAHAFDSHRDLWLSEAIQPAVKEAKAADQDVFGDIYRPAFEVSDPFDPSSYRGPVENHVHAPDDWRSDIDYVARGGRRAALLVGEVGLSFLWSKPMVLYTARLHRGQKKWGLGGLLQQLQNWDTP
jgi:hypothetical protein